MSRPLPGQNLFIGTVHSFCLANILVPYARLAGLDLPNPPVIAALSQLQEHWNTVRERVFQGNNKPSQAELDHYRRTYLDRQANEWKTYNEGTALAIELYEEELRNNGLIDFDDMVLLGLQIVQKNPWVRKLLRARFPILVVDEYQDLGLALHQIVNSLCFDADIRLLAVGDPDQSIYGFTGAQPELLRDLAKRDDVETVHLRINYRCGTKIVRASEMVLEKNDGEFDTPDSTPVGTIDFYHEEGGLQNQAQKICTELIPESLERREGRSLGDIVVLYLDKNDGDVIAEAVEQAGFDFIRIDGNAPYRKTPLTRWLEDCARWCCGGWREGNPRLSILIQTWVKFNQTGTTSDEDIRRQKQSLVRFLWLNRSSDLPLDKWIDDFDRACLQSVFYRGCELNDEYEALDQLLSACESDGKLGNFTVATFAGQGGSPNHLNLITLYSAKGLEYDVVIIMGMDQGRIPSWGDKSKSQKAEKRRLFYVGLTRARHEVHMTYSGWYYDRYKRKHEDGPSEFLIDLRQKLEDKNELVVDIENMI